MESTSPAEYLRSQGLHLPPPALTPTHELPSANQPIELYHGDVMIEVAGQTNTLDATISYAWFPFPHVALDASTTERFAVEVREAYLTIPALQLKCRCLPSVSVRFDETGRTHAVHAMVYSELR